MKIILMKAFRPCLSYKNICTRYGAEGIVEQGGGKEGEGGRRGGSLKSPSCLTCVEFTTAIRYVIYNTRRMHAGR